MRTIIFTLALWLTFSCLYASEPSRGFAIIVDKESFKEACKEIRSYAESIEKYQKLKVYTIVDRWGIPDSIRAELIRLHNLKKAPIEGAVLIGDIPIAMIRDAQHLTSAFKMNQKNDRKESSVPSDRYYDDFHLQFKFIDKDQDEPYFYYSLKAESQQRLCPNIYTGRIRPTDSNGISRYEKLRAYLKKVITEKQQNNALNQILFFSGHGYISESLAARMDEKEALYEHFPWLKRQANGISYIDHSQEDFIKFRLMNELMRPELDLAILHHHGNWDTQYLSNIPTPKNAAQAKEYIQNYCRSKIRSAKESGKDAEEARTKWEENFDIPSSWLNNTFDEETCRKDSLDNDQLDLHLSDFQTYGFHPNSRIVILDACFCGSYHRENSIANEYIFNSGQTVACIANSVNVLQDKWGDQHIGMLGMGMCIGNIARYCGYLESHIIGDPTFCFTPAVEGPDINRLIAKGNISQWKEILNDAASLPDYQCMAIEQLMQKGCIESSHLLEIFRTSPYGIVRMQALVSLASFRNDHFIEALKLAANDSYEMVQRAGINYMAQSGDDRLIPALISLSISNNTSERCNFNTMNALSFYPEKKLIAEFDRQFADRQIRYIDKDKVGATIQKAIISNANKWQDDVNKVTSPDTNDKSRASAIRTLRNYCPHYMIPQLLDYLQTCNRPEFQTALLEALGWRARSYMAPQIATLAQKMSKDSQFQEEVRKEALKTYNRLIPYSPDHSSDNRH